MRDTPESCPGLLHGKWARNCIYRPTYLRDVVDGAHTHYLIWWNKEYDYFSQTKIYRWLQSQRVKWTKARRENYHEYAFDAGDYYNTFKINYMHDAFLIFDPRPPTRQFNINNNPHPLFTLIQSRLNEETFEHWTKMKLDKIINNIGKQIN